MLRLEVQMNCLKCGAPLLINETCSKCGISDALMKKAINTSNHYYNCALDKVYIRNLSDAVQDLLYALKYNKKNIEARNLLGLIYYEMGDVVEALSQWVISINYQEKANIAADYINEVKNNPTKLENTNQTIKKYNIALNYAKQGNKDLALIQIKKVLSLCPNFVKGYLLLALLYMDAEQNDKARKALKRVLRIDHNNTLGLKYMQLLEGNGKSLNAVNREENANGQSKADIRKESYNRLKSEAMDMSVRPVGTYKENTNTKTNFIYLLIGLGLAIVIMWVLIIPNRVNNLDNKYKNLKVQYDDETAKKNAIIENLTIENESLTEQISVLEGKAAGKEESDLRITVSQALLQSALYYQQGNMVEAAKALIGLNRENITSEMELAFYDLVQAECNAFAANECYNLGVQVYEAQNYGEAVIQISYARTLGLVNEDTLYYLARAYDLSGDVQKAKESYEQFVSEFPNDVRTEEINGYLSQSQ